MIHEYPNTSLSHSWPRPTEATSPNAILQKFRGAHDADTGTGSKNARICGECVILMASSHNSTSTFSPRFVTPAISTEESFDLTPTTSTKPKALKSGRLDKPATDNPM